MPFIRPYPVRVADYFRLARHSGVWVDPVGEAYFVLRHTAEIVDIPSFAVTQSEQQHPDRRNHHERHANQHDQDYLLGEPAPEALLTCRSRT
jgi:hypothetical protein